MRVVFRHTIPVRNWLFLLVAVASLSSLTLVSALANDQLAAVVAIVLPVGLGALAFALGISALANRHTISELAMDRERLSLRRWGLFGHTDAEIVPHETLTDWRPETRMGVYHSLSFARAGERWRLPLYNAQLVDFDGLAELAPLAVAEHLRRHGRSLPPVIGA
ncbi:hypothetical protein SAMN02983003_3802 [Devosia enhydra]|uniref:Uncharacterized protein n=1 Tax=Devosia enhydra TaxID=665118 RepID=A0A1K2I4F4_9HYPH|nr:hypothetical protein [Devosia enhydra]SFZ86612.1 hypothetical protein SAMN02983003_3802 [Devosia enhydra]